tara:strand:- start:109 stop:264 length:156 start_codon:yes stop_codon:yes gene_type:complete
MHKLDSFKDSSFEKKYPNDEDQIEKVLCNHCGRTRNNGIRCMGICVADSDY